MHGYIHIKFLTVYKITYIHYRPLFICGQHRRYGRDIYTHFTNENTAMGWSLIRRWLFWVVMSLLMASDRH